MKKLIEQSDTDLEKQEIAIRQEKARRLRVREAVKQKENVRRLMILADNDNEILNKLVPEHTPGRYGRKCDDKNTEGGDQTIDPKDWHCTRCLLLDMIHAAKIGAPAVAFDITIAGYNHR